MAKVTNAIEYVRGDATRPQGFGNKIIVHCCNNEGCWGAGFVMALSRHWPQPEAQYHRWAHNGRAEGKPFELGQFVLVPVMNPHSVKELRVCNLIGQDGVGYIPGERPPIRYDAIDEGLWTLGKALSLTDLWSVHMPRMGAGLAGGDWRIIEAIIVKNLIEMDIPVTVYDLP